MKLHRLNFLTMFMIAMLAFIAVCSPPEVKAQSLIKSKRLIAGDSTFAVELDGYGDPVGFTVIDTASDVGTADTVKVYEILHAPKTNHFDTIPCVFKRITTGGIDSSGVVVNGTGKTKQFEVVNRAVFGLFFVRTNDSLKASRRTTIIVYGTRKLLNSIDKKTDHGFAYNGNANANALRVQRLEHYLSDAERMKAVQTPRIYFIIRKPTKRIDRDISAAQK